MKILLLFFFLLLSFNTSAAYIIDEGSTCVTNNNAGSHLVGSMYLYEQEAIAAIDSVNWSDTQCYGSAYKATYGTSDFRKIAFDSGKKISYYIRRVHSGCDFDTCKQIAEDECQAKGQTFNDSSYFYRGNKDYDSECNPPPPEQPIQNEDDCFNLANNSCISHNSLADMLFTDNNDLTYSCGFSCGDGSTGDENGSHAGNSNGICDPNDPNDLIDCDAPVDPDCIVGCDLDSGAFTPDNTSDLPYNSDGTIGSDGSGTDGMTTLQGDVLINEVKKLKNENAEQTIKSKNAITDAIDNNNNADKLQDIANAVREGNGGSTGGSYDDTNLRNDVDDLGQLIAVTSQNSINASNSNSNSENLNADQNAQDIIAAIKENGLGNDTGSGIGRRELPAQNTQGFYTTEYPFGLSGLFTNKIEEYKTTEFYVFLEQFKPTFTGTPPELGFCMNFGTYMNLGCFNFVLDPRLWPALKIFILITAGFTCRKILFGG
jgi:hypothetical protein